MPGRCNVDSVIQWRDIYVYFDHGEFVGYNSSEGVDTPPAPDAPATLKGLKTGDSVPQAEQMYGPAFSTSLDQGGSWTANTPEGTLDGFLTAEPNQTGTVPLIGTIEAGSVGCPALSP